MRDEGSTRSVRPKNALPKMPLKTEEEDIEHLKGLRWRAFKGDVRECPKGTEASLGYIIS